MLHIACQFNDANSALPITQGLDVAMKAPYLKVRNASNNLPLLYLSEHQSPISNEKEIRESLANMGIRLDG